MMSADVSVLGSLFPVVVAGALVALATGRGSGWGRLARRYAVRPLSAPRRLRPNLIRLGGVVHPRVTLEVAAEGLRLTKLLLPTLQLPWSAVRACTDAALVGWPGMDGVELELEGPADPRLVVYGPEGVVVRAAWLASRPAGEASAD